MERQKNEFGLGAESASASAGGQMKDWQRSGAEALSRGKEAASAAVAEAGSSAASAVQSLREYLEGLRPKLIQSAPDATAVFVSLRCGCRRAGRRRRRRPRPQQRRRRRGGDRPGKVGHRRA
jgi:hypothetical protein